MRYIKQRDGYNCAGIAILNMLKWVGFPATYEGLEYIAKALGTDKDHGTECQAVATLLQAKVIKQVVKVKSKGCNPISPVTSKELAEWCEHPNRSALVMFIAKNNDWHFGFVPQFFRNPIAGGNFQVINWYTNVTSQLIDKKLMAEYLKFKTVLDKLECATVFLIERKA